MMIDTPPVVPAAQSPADAGTAAVDGAKFSQEVAAAKAANATMGNDMVGMLMNSMLQQMLNNSKSDTEE